MMLIDDSRIRRVARAICDPHKDTGCAAAVRVPGVEEDQRAKETPGRQQEFCSILVDLSSLHLNLELVVVIRKKCMHWEMAGRLSSCPSSF